MSFIDKLHIWLRETDLDKGQLAELDSLYAEITIRPDLLTALAVAYKKPIAEVYWECKRARKIIAETIKELK